MIITDHDTVAPQIPGEPSRMIRLPDSIRASLNIYPQQKLYIYPDKNHKQLLAAIIPLKPTVCLHRVIFKDKVGALATVTNFFGKNYVDILKSDDVRIGRLAILEFCADHSKAKKDIKHLMRELKACKDYVVDVCSEPLAIFLPGEFLLEKAPEVMTEWDSPSGKIKFTLTEMILRDAGIDWPGESYIILTAYTRVPFISIQFFCPRTKLVMVNAYLEDKPGTLANGTKTLKNFVDLKASNATTLMLGRESPWRAYGILMQAHLSEMKAALEKTPGVMPPVTATPLGWSE